MEDDPKLLAKVVARLLETNEQANKVLLQEKDQLISTLEKQCADVKAKDYTIKTLKTSLKKAEASLEVERECAKHARTRLLKLKEQKGTAQPPTQSRMVIQEAVILKIQAYYSKQHELLQNRSPQSSEVWVVKLDCGTSLLLPDHVQEIINKQSRRCGPVTLLRSSRRHIQSDAEWPESFLQPPSHESDGCHAGQRSHTNKERELVKKSVVMRACPSG